MEETKIKQETIKYCAKSSPNNTCESCRCTEKECIESLYETISELIESEK